ncbi:MAG: hypothetical protein A3H52_02685 [Candidatus Zambryskibacteria bacterium RIFCSPLOWO2_02_FULL_39_26]|uniref:alanine--tRNA ligase n=1 Tax=Candidatus Zambryskibacteria bacterium RIFCSPLOWO2_12_FULL_39_23 TaxID=1802776 RepID=A0A1G2UTL3_9BACT|nr:MAG: hypothetical protein A3E59_00405 [Candidatus Zambryskibacteria bacterium RIFCSPHIGHO2_12_FULL_39_47]OHB10360.1 MAG: hypothetical protein A3H52_02685 [Candidatus Zambryskibacteria bacterium RIFCSPLOWO2_02_FULL_39_26]OHB12737.1 MAG: hypothetical protein A3G99_01550 [Candidatus Zambryskibacteria bacterium RIFCSPLOWO2_12_FULL_39_23]
MDSNTLRQKFLDFFEKKGHEIIPSASLVPENDPSVLFTTAGMQQFKPYYTGEKDALKDFGSKNTVSIQKCLRTSDIDEVGDDTHLTFFEMLGNFSFGGYWKKEAIQYAHEFITKELGLTIDYVSVFEGDNNTPADRESREIWQEIDSKLVIKNHNRTDNFWGPTGDEGPCGPTTEIYINGVEIWNIVFNEFYKTKEGKYEPLSVRGIDTGMGLERLLVQVQNKKDVYETDLFNNEKTKKERIIADHIKASIFLVLDGVKPANTGPGYILRRLIRKVVNFSNKPLLDEIEKIQKIYENEYGLIRANGGIVIDEISKEEKKFRETLDRGLKEFKKGTNPFILFTTYGFPIELIEELAKEKGQKIDLNDFNTKMAEHQKLSQTSFAGMFKGGLANDNNKTIRHHTAHHLLLAGLQAIVDKNIKQRGSNINEERLRMDFLCDRKLTEQEKKKVEEWVNDKIAKGLPVVRKEMSLTKAKKIGAEMEFGAKYPDTVSIYFIIDNDNNVVSKEFCGGPHVFNTGVLGKFRIIKEEGISAGIRRIKAVLE